MTSENGSDGLASLEDFANLEDIVPKLEAEKTPVEFEISENLLIPGVVIDYLDDHVQFQSTQSDELFDVPYEKVRLTPKLCPDAKFQEGDQVETYVLDSDRGLYGWAASTIKSAVGSTYVVNLVDRNSITIVQTDKVRPITQPVHLHNRFLYRFEIAVPENLHEFANDLEVHEGFHRAIGKPYMSYDSYRNFLVIYSSEKNCESLANMLLTTHFKNLTQRMLLTKNIEQQTEKLEKIQCENFIEQFKVHTDLLKYVIGKKGKNIRKVENIPGITFVTVLKDTNDVRIYAQTKEALHEACMYLKLERETFEIPKRIISKVIGKNGNKVQEMADDSQLRHIIVNKNLDTKSEFVDVDFIGISQSIEHAKILLQYHLNNLADIQQLLKDKYNMNKQYMNVFEDANFKSPAQDSSSSSRVSRRVISGRKYMESEKSTGSSSQEVSLLKIKPESSNLFLNQDLVFYNENLYRGRGRRPSAGSRGRSSRARRARGRYGYQTTQLQADDSEIDTSTDETVKQTSESTNAPQGANSRLVSTRGRGRSRGGLSRTQKQLSSGTERGSQTSSSPNESQEPAQEVLVDAGEAGGAGDASTSSAARELEMQRKQGAIKRVIPNVPQESRNQENTSGTDSQAAVQNEKSWFGKRWRNKNISFSSNRNKSYDKDKFVKVYYGKNNPKRYKNAGEEYEAPNNEPEDDPDDF